MTSEILIIKHGALGDFIQALGAAAAIRQYHPGAHITVLTTSYLASFMEKIPYCDEVWIDDRPRWQEFSKTMSLFAKIKQRNFSRIYDLQTSTRTAFYFYILKVWLGRACPAWSGHVHWCTFPHTDPKRIVSHTLDRHEQQLRIAGINKVAPPHFDWVPPHPSCVIPEKPYALIVAQASAHRTMKWWPLGYYADIIERLANQGIQVVLIGGVNAGQEIPIPSSYMSWVVDLRGKTTILDLVYLGRNASFALGNDTGPMHLFAVAGCPCIVLFSGASDPALCVPRGSNRIDILQVEHLRDLSPDTVWKSVQEILPSPSLEHKADP